MLNVLRRILQEVNTARNLDEVLSILVSRIKQSMDVDAASVYLVDEKNNKLYLAKTEGLSKDAIGRVSFPLDKGLTGYVATSLETVNIANAKKDKRYMHIPDTGEEQFSAFLGSPLIHQRKVLGVLVVQRKEQRCYKEESVAFLIALAAQLAGAIAHAQATTEPEPLPSRNTKEKYFNCVPGAPGIAIGTAFVVYSSNDFDSIPDRPAKDVEKEVKLFRRAVEEVCADIKEMQDKLAGVLSDEDNALFDAYTLLANSDTLVNGTIEKIRGGNWAQGAIRDTIREHALQFSNMADEYMRERAQDIREIGLRIFRKLHSDTSKPHQFPKRTILVGEEIGATQLAEVPAKRIAGVISAKGSHSSHVAILARAMGIPAIMGASNVSLGWLDQCEVIADGYQGRIYVQPPPIVKTEYSRLIREESNLKKELRGLRKLPAESPDGQRVYLMANSGLLANIKATPHEGAEGIGLYRTEFPFMVRSSFPSESEQVKLYRSVLKDYAPKPVTLRTLDVGGDKPLSYFPMSEDNPHLGWRGIRVTLDHPEIFITQIKAMLKASLGLGNLSILFPMISNLDELDEAQTLFEQAMYEVNQEGYEIEPPKIGVMIEVPSAVFQAEAFAKRVDFLSIGTNDLTQYLLAVDRNNARVAKLFDPLHPAVMRAIYQVVEAGKRQCKPVCVCGEMAGDAMSALLLFGMGVNSLSMGVRSLPKVKWLIRSFNYSDAKKLLHHALKLDHAYEVRHLLAEALEQVGLGSLLAPGKKQ